MSDNLKDNRNQNTDSKSHQEQTQEGKKKEEINPNSPKANQINEQDTHQGTQHRPDATKGDMNKPVHGSVDSQTDKTAVRKTDTAEAIDTDSKTTNKDNKTGNM
jgi:hypothetical protein